MTTISPIYSSSSLGYQYAFSSFSSYLNSQFASSSELNTYLLSNLSDVSANNSVLIERANSGALNDAYQSLYDYQNSVASFDLYTTSLLGLGSAAAADVAKAIKPSPNGYFLNYDFVSKTYYPSSSITNYNIVKSMGAVAGKTIIPLTLGYAAYEVGLAISAGSSSDVAKIAAKTVMGVAAGFAAAALLPVGTPALVIYGLGAAAAAMNSLIIDHYWPDIVQGVESGVDFLGNMISDAYNFIDNMLSNIADYASDFMPPWEDFAEDSDAHSDSDGDGRSDAIPLNGIPPIPDPNPDKQASPLVLDLDGDGVELYSSGEYGTYFDLKNTGQAVLTGWVSPDDGLLAFDLNGDGIINNGSELFGSEAIDGFTVLKTYDLNGDGIINADDAIFIDLKVWVDINSDGISQSNELHTLTDLGITEISLDSTRVTSENGDGNTITHEANFIINGIKQTVVDAWFEYNSTITRNVEDYDLDINAMFLPTLRGYGLLKDIHIAASIDNGSDPDTLLSQLESFASNRVLSDSLSDWTSTKAAAENILLRWAGVEDIEPDSRGDYVDARYLAFYEAFRGYEFDQYGSSNPLPEAGQFVNAVFDFLVTWETMKLLAQTSGNEIFTDVSYNIYTGKMEGDFTLLQGGIDAIEDEALASANSADVWAHFAQFLGYTKGLDNLTTSEITALDAAVLATGDPSLSDWQDVVTYMTASLGSIIDSSDDWNSFEIYYDNLTSGTSGDDTITDDNAGGYTDNEFRGLGGNDTIYGLDGHDKLSGGSGNDTLVGGTGDDFLLGGEGDDTYVYDSGNDTISEKDGGGSDTLLISASTGLTEANLTDLYRYNDDLLILLNNGDVITIDGYSSSGQGIETITFGADSYSINLTTLVTQKFYGTSNGDRLTVSGESFQTLLTYGYAGNDTITADGGAALFYGGDGYDTLIGDYLSDTMYGDAQDDALFGMEGNDTLYGGDGNDTLNGGTGNDLLDGGDGDNTFIFNLGYGIDTIAPELTSENTKVVFGAGITTSNIILEREDGSYTRADMSFITTSGDKLVVDDMYARNNMFFYLVEKFVFADGTVWNSTDVHDAYISQHTTSGNDTVYGFEMADTFLSSAGDDYIAGYSGADTYYWGIGSGNDTIFDRLLNINNGTGADTIQFTGSLTASDLTFSKSGESLIIQSNATSDSITILKFFNGLNYYRIENFVFSNGTTLTYSDIYTMTVGGELITGTDNAETLTGNAGINRIEALGGNDTLKGLDGDDMLIGGDGNDTLEGGNDNDTYIADSGADIIKELSGSDEILFGPGITLNDLDIYRLYEGAYSEHLMIVWSGGSIKVDQQYYDISTDKRVELIRFDDGSTYNLVTNDLVTKGTSAADTLVGEKYSLFSKNDTIFGYGGDDTIQGLTGNDLLYGGDGNDNLQGGDDNDTLDGGDGNDLLEGGNGNDIYVHSKGTDTIADSYNNGGVDKIVFEAGILLSDLSMYRSGDNLIIDVSDGSSITISSQFNTSFPRTIESIGFSNGSTYSFDSTHQIEIRGTASNDTLNGNSLNASINDLIYGYAGNDTISAKTGDDIVYGGDGNDTLNGEDGNDYLYGDAGTDTLNGGNNDDTIDGGSDADTIDAGSGNDTVIGGAGDDIIYGRAGNDTISAGDGDDVIYEVYSGTDAIDGGAGVDTLDYSGASSYRVTISLQTGIQSDSNSTPSSDTITGIENVIGGSGNDTMTGSDVANILQGGSGNDALYGQGGNDTLKGDAGTDTLRGEDGNDYLYGGSGLDTMYGGLGADSFVFEAASAFSNIDVIKDFSTSQGDKVDIKDLLVGYDPLTSAITDFLQITTSGSNSIVKVDRDGTGTSYTLSQISTIEGVTGLTDEQALLTKRAFIILCQGLKINHGIESSIKVYG